MRGELWAPEAWEPSPVLAADVPEDVLLRWYCCERKAHRFECFADAHAEAEAMTFDPTLVSRHGVQPNIWPYECDWCGGFHVGQVRTTPGRVGLLRSARKLWRHYRNPGVERVVTAPVPVASWEERVVAAEVVVLSGGERWWRPEDLQMSPTRARHVLTRLSQAGELTRVRKSLFWRGVLTLSGERTPPPVSG